MDEPVTSSCYNGQDLAFAVIGTIIVWTIVLWLLSRLYQKYWRNRKESQLEDPENAKQEFAFDNNAMESDLKSEKTHKHDHKLELANNNDNMLVKLRAADYIANGLEIGPSFNGGISVKKYNHAVPSINIGDTITSIRIDCKNISEEDANTILRYASPYNVHFGLEATSANPSTFIEQTATFHTDRETKLLENYPTLKIDEKIFYESVKSNQSSTPVVVTKIEEHIVSNVSKQKEENRAVHKSDDSDAKLSLNAISKHTENTNELLISKNIDDVQGSYERDDIIKPISNTIEENRFVHKLLNSSVDGNQIEITNGIQIDTSAPPPVNKRTKYLKPENSTEETLTKHFFIRNSSINSSGIARDEEGIPLELPTQMTESAKWTHVNRKSITASSIKPEPMSRANTSIPPTSAVMAIDSENNVDHIKTEIKTITTEKVNGIQSINNGHGFSDETDGILNYSTRPADLDIKIESNELHSSIDYGKNSNITFESGLVEQVLAVADGFSNETKATLTRQLSELNDDPIINLISSTTVHETNNNKIQNDEKLPATLKSIPFDHWNKQQIEQRSEQITINDTLLSDDIDHTIYPSSWSEQPSSITFESSQVLKTQIQSSEIYGDLDTTIDNAVFSSDNQGVNSINITSIEIPGKLSLGNVVTLNPSQPSSIIVIENDAIENNISKLTKDTQFATTRIDSSKQDDDEPHTFVTEIALKKQTNIVEKLPPHAPARIVNASAKSTTESSETRTIVTHRPPLERGKSHSEIPVLVRKTSIPTLPSLSTISPALSTSNSSLSRSSPSKIPVFNTKSISPDREFTSTLIGKSIGNGAMSRSHSTLSARSSNPGTTLISVTSIKNSSRNPSGK